MIEALARSSWSPGLPGVSPSGNSPAAPPVHHSLVGGVHVGSMFHALGSGLHSMLGFGEAVVPVAVVVVLGFVGRFVVRLRRPVVP